MARKLFTFERPDGVHVDVEVPETESDFPDTVSYAAVGQVIVHLPVKVDGRDVIGKTVWDRIPDDWKLIGGDVEDGIPAQVATSGEPAAPEVPVDPNVLLTEKRRIDPNIGNGPLGAIDAKKPKPALTVVPDEDELPPNMTGGPGGWYYITAPDGEEHKVQTKSKALELYLELHSKE